MNNTTSQSQYSSAGSGPSTIEIIIGLLTLVLDLAAVVVAIAQLHQARTANRRQIDPESGHANIEMVPSRNSSHAPDANSFRSDHSVNATDDTTATAAATDAANVVDDVPDP